MDTDVYWKAKTRNHPLSYVQLTGQIVIVTVLALLVWLKT